MWGIPHGTVLNEGEVWLDADRELFVTLEANGNVACYRGTGLSDIQSQVWESGPCNPTNTVVLKMMLTGDLAVDYPDSVDDKNYLWSSGTGPGGTQWFMTFDYEGYPCVYTGTPDDPGVELWTASGDVMLKEGWIFGKDVGLCQAFMDDLRTKWTTLEEWENRKQTIRNGMLRALDLTPERAPERIPLNPQYSSDLRTYDGFTAQEVALQVARHDDGTFFYATGTLYKPTSYTGQLAGIISAHGHGGRTRADRQRRCQGFARMGAVVFAVDMVGYMDSEDWGWKHHTAPEVLKMQTWNNMRVLDFLCSLPEVDTNRLAITGCSGGASQTFYLAAMDPRITCSIPVCQLSAEFTGGCECERQLAIHHNRTHSTVNAEIGCLTAPNPQLIITDGQSTDGTQNMPTCGFPYIQEVYNLYGAGDNVENLHLPNEGHDYGTTKYRAAFTFFAEHLGMNLEAVKPGGVWDESWDQDESDAVLKFFNNNFPADMVAAQTALPRSIPVASRPPIFTSTPVTRANLMVPYSYAVEAYDVDGDALTFSGVSVPSWLNFNPSTAVLSGTPVITDSGTHAVCLRVSDGTHSVDQLFPIIVEEVAVPGPNLVLNHSFENGSTDWVLGDTAQVTTADAQEGSSSLMINQTASAIRQTVGLEVGVEYNLSVWINAAGLASENVVFDTQDEYDDTCQFNITSANGGWTEYTGSFTATDTDVVLRVFAVNADFSGTVYIDNIVLASATGGSTGINLATPANHIDDCGDLQTGKEIAYLHDGSTSSSVAKEAGNIWVEYDFGSEYALSSARLFGDDGESWNSQSWTMQAWDGNTYVDVFTASPCYGTQWFEESIDVTTSKVKVFINGTAAGTEVFELEILGIPVSVPTGYDAWVSNNGVVGGPADDDDRDGLPNLLEYATGGDPGTPGDDIDPAFVKSGNTFQYTYDKRNDDANLLYTVEVCADLASGLWTDTGVAPVINGTTGSYDNVTHTILADQPQSYLRLKIRNQ